MSAKFQIKPTNSYSFLNKSMFYMNSRPERIMPFCKGEHEIGYSDIASGVLKLVLAPISSRSEKGAFT